MNRSSLGVIGASLAVAVGCSALPQPDDGPTRLEEWEASLPEYLETASDYQARIIEDGVVTRDEHEAALADFIRCAEEGSGVVVSVERGRDGEVGGITTSGFSAKFDRCREEFFTYVGLGYDAMLNPGLTPGGLVRALVACLRQRGVENLPPNADQMELGDLSRTVAFSDDGAGTAMAKFNECYDLHG